MSSPSAGRFSDDAVLLASLPHLPDPTARPVLVVMSGLPGTGKSTVARALTDTFSGIRPIDAPPFIVAQFIGALLAVWLFKWMFAGRQ